jgi:hypothetical protein
MSQEKWDYVVVLIWNVPQRLICKRFSPQLVVLLRADCIVRVLSSWMEFTYWWVHNWMDLWRWSLFGESGHWGCAFEGCILSPTLPILLSASWPPWGEQFSNSPHPLSHDLLRPRNDGAKWLWTETSDTMSQNKSSFISNCFFQAFCESDRKLTRGRSTFLSSSIQKPAEKEDKTSNQIRDSV